VGWLEDRWRCFFFLRDEASVPEASERLGLAGLFRDMEALTFLRPPSRSLACFSLRPEGVFVPEEERADFLPSGSSLTRLTSFSFSRRSRSSSESDWFY
jgi:hypothetical protein